MDALALIGVAGFASAWMLLWGAAAAIPVLLHLLNRRRQQTVSWAAMRLLMQVIEKQTKRVRMEQLLLLILRAFILITLGLTLARPFFTPHAAAGFVATQRAPRLWILVIDSSYSMGFREESGQRFAAAQARAVELVRKSMRGDAFAVLTLSSPSIPVIFQPTLDIEATAEAINKIQLLDGGGDLASTFGLIHDVIGDAHRNLDLPTDIHIVFLSDFGTDSWEDALATGRLQSPLKQLAAAHTVSYEPLANEEPSNAAIMTFAPSQTRALKNRTLIVKATVTNFGSVELKNVPVQFAANGQSVESQFLDLPAGASRALHLNWQPTAAGLVTLSVNLPDDRLTVDNQRQAVVEICDEFRVLCVENPHSDGRILRAALQPPITAPASMQVTSVSQLELSSLELNDFDAVILNDLASLSSLEFDRLSQFVRSGSALVCLFGQNADRESWNDVLGEEQSLLGFRLLEASEFGEWRIDPRDYASPIAAPFAEYPDAGLLTTPVFRFWKIQLDESVGKGRQIELQLHGDLPLVVVNTWGNGRAASLLSAPQTGAMAGQRDPWNAMASWPSFVPLMQQLVQTAVSESPLNYNLIVGQPIAGSQRATGDTTVVHITRPDGQQADLQATEVDQAGFRAWCYSGTLRNGLYQVGVDGDQPHPFAVNIDPKQSDLRSVSVNQLPQSSQKPPASVSSAQSNVVVPPSNKLSRRLLGALALMLIAESCLAWRLGRQLA